MNGPLVEFRDVAVLRDDVLMLDGATGSVGPGEVLALTGANGAGKTTLLRVVAGLLPATAGTVRVAGRAPDDRDRAFRRSLAALIGPPQTARDLTIDEHLRFIAATWGASPDTASARAAELLDALAIAPLARRYPHELSSGQSQLAAIALTLARPFDVLCLDEPEQRLDADRLGLVIEALRGVAARGAAVLVASHSPRLVDELGASRLHLVGEV
ncbi:ABC transporter ATP-binding protein [Brachybacterium huguangmaarense]